MNNKILFSICGVGLILVIVGLVGWLGVMPGIIHDKIAQQIYIDENNTDTFDVFKEMPVPLKFSIWAFEANTSTFDGKNVNTITYSQRGPYVFNEYRYKENIQFSENGENVSFIQKKNYTFNKEESCSGCSPDDSVTLYNVIHSMKQETLNTLRFWASGEPKSLAVYDSLSITDGIYNLALGKSDNLGRSLLGYDEMNPSVVSTGKFNIDTVGQFLEYDNEPVLDVWLNDEDGNTSTCNQLKGTDATQFKPGLKGDETLWVYSPEICLMLYAQNTMDNVDVKGISTIRYVIQKENFAATEENRCHCFESNDTLCESGILNLKNCPTSKGFEAIASPGFFYDQPDHIEKMGLSHIKKKEDITEQDYATTLDVEPLTGIVLRAQKKLMFSMKVRKNAVPALENLTDIFQYAPLLYVEETAEVDDANAQKLKDKIAPKKIFTGVLIALIVIGILMILGSAIMYFRRKSV